jgi:hypothetical protein
LVSQPQQPETLLIEHPLIACHCFADGLEKDLHSRLRQCAIGARQAGVRAEDLLVAIREAWHALPDGRDLSSAQRARLTDLINTALEAYYAN